MRPGAPWSVKGIEPQARETAKSAARRAGMTLGEWLNQVILDSGIDTVPTADPMRAPEDWMLETGQELPWTRPIEDMSARVSSRLAVSEAENAALLGSIETAIGGITSRLIELDSQGPSSPTPNLDARLSQIETRQERALSKDNLKSLETAVGQISVVLDNQAGKQNAAARDQGERIDRSQQALIELAAHLEQTEDRVGQALSAVEAASELYDITDKQGQMIDSLVMDVAGLYAEQKESDAQKGTELSALADDLFTLKARVKDFEDKAAEDQASPSDEARLAVQAISEQISASEGKTTDSVSQIEEQISGLSQVLDRSLQAHQTGIEGLSSAFNAVLKRVEALESRSSQTDSKDLPPASPLEETIEPPTSAEESVEEVIEKTRVPPVTFKTLAQQTSKNVNLKMAVTIDQDFVRKQDVPTQQGPDDLTEFDDLPGIDDLAEIDDLPDIEEIEIPESADEVTLPVVEADDMSEVALEAEPALAEIAPKTDTETDIDTDIEIDAEFEVELEAETDDGHETTAQWDDQVESAISDHMKEAETLEDEPLTFSDIFGEPEGAPFEDQTENRTGNQAITPEDDAALREAVTNISSIRASWAAKNEAQGRPGSMRQIVDIDDEDASKRGWALTAGGLMVGLIAISGVLVLSGETNDLIDAGERPALFDQITSWIPGRSPVPDITNIPADPLATPDPVLASAPGASGELQTLLAALPAGLEEAARAGDARAQFSLGRALANGDGRPVDRPAALQWYKAAAGQGLAIAQYVLGSLHERGIDVGLDKEVAIDWYASAARGGNRRSMHNLAVAYARGDVIDQDLTQAAYWFSEAAGLGLPDSQYNLALLYERGLGVDKDVVTALQWYRIAAAGGDQAASTQAKRLGEKLTVDQREVADSFVSAWQQRSMAPIANGFFDISPEAWISAGQRTDLAIVQSHLMTLGYTLAGSDGIMDPVTRKAITDFQTSNNLDVTGTVTPGLYESLTGTGRVEDSEN